MLLIVINDEKPNIKQAGEETARYFAGEVKIPECPREGAGQE
jgi:hypothetical protein